MSKSAQENSENITISELAATDETLIQSNLIADSDPVSEIMQKLLKLNLTQMNLFCFFKTKSK